MRSYAHDKPTTTITGFGHEVERELAGELDKPVVAGLCDDEDILNM